MREFIENDRVAVRFKGNLDKPYQGVVVRVYSARHGMYVVRRDDDGKREIISWEFMSRAARPEVRAA